MNLGRIADIFRKARQLETLTKSCSLLQVHKCNPTYFPKSTSNFANLNRCIIPANNYSKCHTLFKLPIQSTVNIIPNRAASSHGDHVRLWVIERIISASFLALIPAALLLENKFIDIILATATVMHTYWGLEAIIVDYVRPIVVGTVISKLAFFVLNLLSVVTLAGLLVLIYNGPGLTKIIKQGWTIEFEEFKKKKK